MALLDPKRQCIVVRVVYDGPAYAGKTTNLRSLAQSLGSEIFSSEEADGRTLYFDWVDYVGGLFEGMPIRCQIVSVPGQRVLESRRRLLLETADAVVFVADSRPEQLAENVQSFELLRQVVQPMEPPVGIVVQANKRDVEEATSLEALHEALARGTQLAMTEAISDKGDGVRVTFVLAVRLALDRVRDLWDRKALPRLTPEIDDGSGLLSALQAAEDQPSSSLASIGLGGADRRVALTPSLDESQPRAYSSSGSPPLPEASVPPGLVWPPVAGRVSVHELARAETQLERSANGEWIGRSDAWIIRSPLEGLFFDLEEARAALLRWAQWHSSSSHRLSEPRCLVVVPESNGVWRLWQVVRRVDTLRDKLTTLFLQADDQVLGRGLFQVVELRLRSQREFVSNRWIGRLDLDSVGTSERGEPLFTGFAPYRPISPSTEPPVAIDEDRLIRDELGQVLRSEFQLAPRRITGVLRALRRTAETHHRPTIANSIQHVLLGS